MVEKPSKRKIHYVDDGPHLNLTGKILTVIVVALWVLVVAFIITHRG